MKSNPNSTKTRLAKARAAKVKAYRLTNHLRADGWTEPEKRMEVAERLCRHRIRRIEFPKYGEPVRLSEADKDDCLQAGLTACVEANFFEHGIVTKDLSLAIRRAMEGRACLRRDRTWEFATGSPEIVAAEVGFVTEDEAVSRRLTIAQRDEARRIMADLRVARELATSRKSMALFRSNRDFFIETVGHLTGRISRQRSGEAFRQSTKRLLSFLQTAYQADRAARPAPRDVWGLEASFAANFATA